MAERTGISWAHSTFNPWLGCTNVSPGCDHCYAEALAKRTGLVEWGNHPRRRTSAAYWKQPLVWNRKAAASGRPWRVFCASMADVFDNQVPDEWRSDLWKVIEQTPNLIWMLLTKRPQNIGPMLPPGWGGGWPNVWPGTTVENQEEAERRIPILRDVPARVRFVSCEPMLGSIDLRRLDIKGDSEMDCLRPSTWREVWESDWSPEATGVPLEHAIEDYKDEGGVWPPTDDRPVGISWVICGGESGAHARPMHPAWARSLRDQCATAGVPFHFKQWGGRTPKAGGCLLDGREHKEFPATFIES